MKLSIILMLATLAIAGCSKQQASADGTRTSGDTTASVTSKASEQEAVKKVIADFQKQMSDDWMVIESPKLDGTRNLSIILDRDHELASAIYETPFSGKFVGRPTSGTMRFAQTFRKENGTWKIAHGLVSIATVGQSSAQMVEQIKKGKM